MYSTFPKILTQTLLLFLIAFICFIFFTLKIETRFEHKFYDWRIANKGVPTAATDIIVIETTAEDVAHYNQVFNEKVDEIPVEVFAEILDRVLAAQPRHIAYFLNPIFLPFNSKSYQKLAHVLQKEPSRFTLGTTYNENGLLKPPPLQDLNIFAWQGFAVYHMNDVARSVILSWNTLSGPIRDVGSAIYQKLTGKTFSTQFKKQITRLPFIYHNPPGYYFNNFHDQGITTYHYQDLIKPGFSYAQLQGKIVLVGSGHQPHNSGAEVAVLHPTSAFNLFNSREPPQASKVTIWAWTLRSILTDQIIQQLPKWIKYIAATFLIITTYYAMIYFNLLLGTLLAVLLATCLWFFSFFLLAKYALWFNLATPYFFMIITLFIAMFYKISSQMEITWNLNEKLNASQEVSRIKSHFMTLISNDLAESSERILQQLATLKQPEIILSATSIQALAQTVTTAREFNTYIQNILNFARFESEKPRIHTQPVNLITCMTCIADQFDFKLRSKQMTIIMPDPNPHFVVDADQHLMEQIFSNIIGNAIKYAPEATTIAIRFRRQLNHIIIQVEDEGIGIAENLQDKIFEKFYRVKDDHVYALKGTGLGLYLVRFLIELHHGQIWVNNNRERGCTFTMAFPLSPSPMNALRKVKIRRQMQR